MPGFEEHFALLDATIARVEAAALVAAHTAMALPWEQSQGRVPVRTTSLKNSGHHPEAEFINATTVLDGISYGGPSYPKENVDYAIIVHEGSPPHEIRETVDKFGKFVKGEDEESGTRERIIHSKGSNPNKFLEGPILEAVPQMEEIMGAVFQEVFAG